MTWMKILANRCILYKASIQSVLSETSMPVLLIVGLKCTLAASHATPGESRWVWRWDRQTEEQTNGRQTVTLRFPLDSASVIKIMYNFMPYVRV